MHVSDSVSVMCRVLEAMKPNVQHVSKALAPGQQRVSELPVLSGCPSLTQVAATAVQHLFYQIYENSHRHACVSERDFNFPFPKLFYLALPTYWKLPQLLV